MADYVEDQGASNLVATFLSYHLALLELPYYLSVHFDDYRWWTVLCVHSPCPLHVQQSISEHGAWLRLSIGLGTYRSQFDYYSRFQEDPGFFKGVLRVTIVQRWKKITLGAILLVISVPLLLLYVWLLFNSINARPLFSLFPTDPSLRSWIRLFAKLSESPGMPDSVFPILGNTVIVAGGVMFLNLFVCGMAGYAISRLAFRGKEFLMSSLLILKAFPLLILLIATYFVLFYLRLLNTFLSVILARTAMEMVMGTWIIKGFFDDIPREIEDAAKIDGTSLD